MADLQDGKGGLEGFLRGVLGQVPGVQAILLSDREGVVLASAGEVPSHSAARAAGSADYEDDVDDEGEGKRSDAALAAVFGAACDQAAKSGLGKTSSAVAFYDNRLIVHINALPVVISIIAEPEANVGLLLALAPELRAAIDPLRQQIQLLETQAN